MVLCLHSDFWTPSHKAGSERPWHVPVVVVAVADVTVTEVAVAVVQLSHNTGHVSVN